MLDGEGMRDSWSIKKLEGRLGGMGYRGRR
jgi:hypothetical protein